jgi:hypothetical protein
MGFLLIGVIYEGKNISGYRLLDTDNHTTTDASSANVMDVLRNRKATIDNLELQGVNLVGTNGAIERYPKLKINKKSRAIVPSTTEPAAVTIINRIGDLGFTVCNVEGKVVNVKTQDLLTYAEKTGIANGKIVTQPDGTKFISAISGNYKTINIQEPVKLEAKPEVKPVQQAQSTEVKSSTPSVNQTTQTYQIVQNNQNTEQSAIADLFTPEQKSVINDYYEYYYNREKVLHGTSKEAKAISKLEITKMSEQLSSGNLKYYEFQAFIDLISLIDSEEELGKLTNDKYAKSVTDFIYVKLPIPFSMINILIEYLQENPDDILKSAFKNYSKYYTEAMEYKQDNAARNFVNELKHSSLRDSQILKSFKQYLSDVAIVSETHELLASTCVKYHIVLEDLLSTISNNYDSDIATYPLMKNTKDDVANYISENGAKATVEKILTAYADSKLHISKPQETVVDAFNTAYEKHKASTDESEIVERPDRIDIVNTIFNSKTDTENSNTQENSEPSEKPESMTSDEWIDLLIEKNKSRIDSKDIDISIAMDIRKRKLQFDSLSAKQKYRYNRALEKLESTNRRRLKISEPTQKSNSTSSTNSNEEVNNHYELNEHPEILKDVTKIISLANSVEMQAVLEQSPNVIKICYSIMKNGRASDRQLKHVNLAIKILDEQ